MIDQIKTTTDHKPRPLRCLQDLPEKVQKDFDYIKDEERFFDPRFVEYKCEWYDVEDTQFITTQPPNMMGWNMHVTPDHPFAPWNRLASDTFFRGILFKVDYENETVICGRYCT